MVNEFNHITEILSWATFTEDKDAENIRVSIRSRGPVINKVAEKYGGGGHIYAAGTRVNNFEEVDNLINDLNECTRKYKEEASTE